MDSTISTAGRGRASNASHRLVPAVLLASAVAATTIGTSTGPVAEARKAPTHPNATCGERVEGPNGSQYLLVCVQVSFAQARSAAEARGGHLVTIGSPREQTFVKNLIDDAGAWNVMSGDCDFYNLGPWLGLVQGAAAAEPDGGWAWVTDDALDYRNWPVGEPNDGRCFSTDEGVRNAVMGDDGYWFDVPADELTSYVIEWDQPLAVDWTMPDRLTLTTPEDQYWQNYRGMAGMPAVYPRMWQADVFLVNHDQRYECPKDVRFYWQVKALDGGRAPKPSTSCSLKLLVSKLGRYEVTATREVREGIAWRRDRHVTGTVLLKDWLIVGLGDSNASGEGNPSTFFYKRCNRGTASYQYQTALYIERQDPRTSVTFVFPACSGARIQHLVDTPYAGTRPPTTGLPLPPQIEQVSFVLWNLGRGAPRKIDAALVSIGVNDLAFGPLMKYCLTFAEQSLLIPGTPCPDHHAIPKLDEVDRISAYQPSRKGATLRKHENTLLGQLAGRYPALARALKKPVGKTGGLALAPNRVFITQYPDFTHGSDGGYCDTRDGSVYAPPNWGSPTWTWISLLGGRLNQKVKAAASTYGWHMVPADLAAYSTRGYCNKSDSLFAGIFGSALRWNLDGPFHPNAEAHRIAMRQNVPLVCQRLYGSNDCSGRPL